MTKKTLKLIFQIVLLVGTVVSLYFAPWPILNAWLTPLPHTIQDQVNKANDYGFDGIVVYVDQTGKSPVLYSAGYKNTKEKIPADPNALFKIASVGKLYNALAVTKLVRRGRLRLDRTLAEYLPDIENRIDNADKITLRMMVRHRSGIPNYTDAFNYWADPKESDDEKLALVFDQPSEFEPDQKYAYSNTNYLLLGIIMDRALGYDHFQFIQETILKPLGLRSTFASIHDVNPEDVMSGYYVGYNMDLKADDTGSMLATAEDVGKFIRALNDGSIFGDKKEQEIYSSVYEYGHTGLIPGYQTIAKYHPDIDAVVIQFTNTVDFDGYNWSLSEIMYSRVVKILRNKN